MEIAFNGMVGFVQALEGADLSQLNWTELKYLDDWETKGSDDMINCRLPGKERQMLGVINCCLRTQEECTAEREANAGKCLRRDCAYDARRAARANGGAGIARRQERARQKEVAQQARKRQRQATGAEKAAEMEAMAAEAAKRPCPGWLEGRCARHGTREDGRRFCKRAHAGKKENGEPIDPAVDIPCAMDPCHAGMQGKCPYKGPHIRV